LFGGGGQILLRRLRSWLGIVVGTMISLELKPEDAGGTLGCLRGYSFLQCYEEVLKNLSRGSDEVRVRLKESF
jgi:hypothetical protein